MTKTYKTIKLKKSITTQPLWGRRERGPRVSDAFSAGLDGFRVKNFKSWKDSGPVQFSRINLIFGQNSSGKSAFIQSILSNSEEQNILDYDLSYRLNLESKRLLQLLTSTLDLGDFNQVHRSNSSKKGIVTEFFNESVGISISHEYVKDKNDHRPRVKNFNLNFKDTPYKFHFEEGHRRRNIHEILVNGSIKFKTKTLNSFDEEYSFINDERRRIDTTNLGNLFEVDCSSLEYSHKLKTKFLVPRYEQLLYVNPPGKSLGGFPGLRFNPRSSNLYGLSKKEIFAQEFGEERIQRKSIKEDTDLLNFDSNLSLLGRLIDSSIRLFDQDLIHIPPIRGIPSRISTTLDLERQDPSVAYVYKRLKGSGNSQKNRLLRKKTVSELKNLVNKDLKELGISYQVDVVTETFNGAPLTNILLVDKSNKSLSLLDVGRGISQLLPIIVSAHCETGSTIMVEQPEVHIHPKLQADLADLFINSKRNQWIIETHSENLLYRIQRRIREGQLKPEDARCIYVESVHGEAKPISIGFRADGSLEREFPKGFFDVAFEEFLSAE